MKTRIIKHFCTILAFFVMQSTFVFGQKSEEIRLKSALNREKKETRKFTRLLILGEFYKNHNIYLADSISHVILQKSRHLDDLQRFKALLFTIQIEEIEGNQENFYKDVLALEPFLKKLSAKEVKFEIYKYLGLYQSKTLGFEKAIIYLNEALDIAKKS